MPTINVIDMSHHNRPIAPDFAALKSRGVFAIIHKASEGASYRDPNYASRRVAAQKAGLLWGAYHFMTSAPVAKQIENFIQASGVGSDIETQDANILLCCDYEDYQQNSPTLKQCMEFIRGVEQIIDGVSVVLYSGNRIRETLREAKGGSRDADMADTPRFFQQHRLWLAQYGPKAVCPWPWNTPVAATANQEKPLAAPGVWLWQFTERGRIDPLKGNTDGNFFDGTFEQLSANWVR